MMKTFTMFVEDRDQQMAAVHKVLNFMAYELDTEKHPEWKDLVNNLLIDPKKVNGKDLVAFLDDHICPDMCLGIPPVRFSAMIKHYLSLNA